MPNILLLGCQPGLVARLQADPAWSVALAFHAEDPHGLKPTAPAPDPTHWDLIVDDCEHDQSLASYTTADDVPIFRITTKYISESDRSHGIRPCTTKRHLRYALRGVGGERHLVLRPTDCPQAIHLAEFVDLFEEDLVNARIARENDRGVELRFDSDTEHLYLNYYDHPVISVTHDGPPWLYLTEIRDEERRQAALAHLIERTAGRLWPEIWANYYQPRRAIRLDAELDALITDTRRRREALEQEIYDARAAYAPYASIIRLQSEALKNLTHRVFGDVFGFDVKDLDDALDPAEEKRLDLHVSGYELSAIVEVRGSAERNAQVERDLDRFSRNLRKTDTEPLQLNARVIVFNGRCTYSMDERRRTPTFSSTVVEEATDRGICLISTFQLLQAIEAFWEGELARESLVAALQKPGLFDLTSDFGQMDR